MNTDPSPLMANRDRLSWRTRAKESLGRLTRVEFDDKLDGWLLTPPLALAAAMTVSCACVSFRIPLGPLIPMFWMGMPLLIVAALWWNGGVLVSRAGLLLSLIAAVCAWAVLAEVTGRALPNEIISYHPDAWSYGAMADFFKNYGRGNSVAGLPMIDQFGQRLQNTRYGSASALAFLSAAPGSGGVVAAHRLFYEVCLVVFFFALCYFARALTTSWFVAIGAAVFGTAGGWLAHVVTIGNYDSLLFVALVPAWLGVVVRFERGRLRPAAFVTGSGVLLASLFDVYPEGAALLAVLVLPLAIQLLAQCFRVPRRGWILGASAAVTFLIVLPYLPIFLTFLYGQIAVATDAAGVMRPGSGNFVGLLDHRFLPALFALGEELPSASYRLANCLLPGFLAACAVWGAFVVGKEHRWFPWAGLPLLVLSLWQGAIARYDYGYYKVLLCASWWIYPAIAAGFWNMAQRCTNRPWALGTLSVLLAAAVAFDKWEDRSARIWRESYSLRPLQALTHIDDVVGHASVLLDIDNDFEYLWATLFLRGHPLGAMQLRSYYLPLQLHKDRLPRPEDCRFVLVNGQHAGAVWHNQRFSLLPNRGARLSDLANTQGVETRNGRTFFWLGAGEAIVSILAMEKGAYELRASGLIMGPSFPTNSVDRRVEVTDSLGRREVVLHAMTGSSAPAPAIPVFLRGGENRVVLRSLDPPVTAPHRTGDTRDLVVGIEGLSLSGPFSAAEEVRPFK